LKLLRIGKPGQERPAIIDEANAIRDLSGVVGDIDGAAISPESLARLRATDLAKLPVVDASERIGPCVARPLNYVCIGLNYADHAREAGMPLPKEPIIFLKSLSAYSGPDDDVIIPRGSKKTDWEVELGVVIGTRARNVPLERALDYVAGYCVCNDISEREYQIERGGQWDKGKGCDTFGPTGPWLVTKDEIPDPQNLALWLDVDGVRMQSGNTSTMVFGVAEIVSYVSQFITLHPGDIISTGTPPGVGMGRKPEPVYLKPGQVMRVGVAGLGEQTQRAVAYDDAAS
jgi:ureidoglycolate lyase